MQYKKFFPFAIFLVVAGFLWKGLLLHPELNSNAATNVVKFDGKKKFIFPEFNLHTVENEIKIANKGIFFNKISLVTVWHSACSGCILQNKFLQDLQASTEKFKANVKLQKLQFVGINFADSKEQTLGFLYEYGNPYILNILDKNGSLGVSLGVLGTPETYLVDQNANIVLKFVGTINSEVWNTQVLPAVKLLLDNA